MYVRIVVPCFNEARRFPSSAFDHCLARHEDTGFVLVNDGSSDETLEVLRDLERRWPGRVEVVDQQPNRGKAEAVRVGMLRAMDGTSTYVGYFDADLATPLEAIPEFVEVLEREARIDLVMGARVALLGRNIARNPVRHYLGRVFATAASSVLGLPVYDTQCGAKLMRSSARLRTLFDRPFGSRWIFDVELLARYLAGPGARDGLYELPLRSWTDVGESRVKSVDFLRAVGEMAAIFRNYPLQSPLRTLLVLPSALFARYVAAGAVGTAVHFAMLAFAVGLLGANPALASVAGALGGATVNYFLNYHLTFASSAPHRRAAPRFFAVAGLSAALHGVGMWAGVQRLGVHYLVAQVCCTAAIVVIGFLLNKAWTFHAGRPTPASRGLGSSRTRQLLVIAAAAVALSLPCLLRGIPLGYDSWTHVSYQHHFSRQFWEGDLYPRWLSDENDGLGSPIFLIQYPLPYFVTAALRPVAPFAGAERESRELGVFVFLAVLGAGIAAWSWLRQMVRPEAATLAAVAYMALPYFLEEGVYVRAAVGELSALACMPLALACCEAAHRNRSRAALLAVAFALLIVSNLLNALLFAPALLAYAMASGRRAQWPLRRSALCAGRAMVLGAALAGVYLVPLFAYRHLFDERQMPHYLPGFELGRYFLLLTAHSLEHRGILVAAVTVVCFSAIVVWYLGKAESPASLKVAIATLMVLGWAAMTPDLGEKMIRNAGFTVSDFDGDGFFSQRMLLILFPSLLLGVVSFCAIARERDPRGVVLLGCAGLSFVLMVPAAAWIWRVPALAAFQFPHRLGGLLHVAVIGLLALAIDRTFSARVDWRRSPPLWMVAGAALCVAAGGALTWRTDRAFLHPATPKFDPARDVDMMYRTYVDPAALPAFAAGLGTELDSYDVPGTPWEGRPRAGLSAGEGSIRVDRETSRRWRVTADTRGDARAWIGQTYSRLWRIEPVDRSSATPSLRVSPRGLLEVSLPAGKQSFYLVFDGGHAEALGWFCSAAALLVLGGTALRSMRERRNPNAGEESADCARAG
jgi:putative flippase GtrA